jgi:hypothetical protein
MTDAKIETSPFDRNELIPCTLCKRGVMHSGPIFYELAMTQCVADVQSIRQQHGLETMFGGNVGIALAFAPSTRVAQRLPAVRHLICAECAIGSEVVPIAFLPDPDQHEGGAA